MEITKISLKKYLPKKRKASRPRVANTDTGDEWTEKLKSLMGGRDIDDPRKWSHRGCEELCNYIVKQAAGDYRICIKAAAEGKRPLCNGRFTSYIGDAKKIEKFFRSPWFAHLTSIDPEWLIENLRRTAGVRTMNTYFGDGRGKGKK